MMDLDLDFNLLPSEIIYGARAIQLDPANQGYCYQGTLNGRCVGVSIQGTGTAPGAIGSTPPLPLAIPSSNAAYPYVPGGITNMQVAVYGPNRNCLIEIDPSFAGQIKPGDLIRSSNSGYGTLASPTGAYNQWIIGIARTFANGGQCCNIKVSVFPWLPTGS